MARLPFYICCDNLLTSLDLLAEIQRRGFHGTGTMRGNRLPKANKLTDIKTFKKKPKGAMEEVTAASSGSTVVVVRWMDNNVVTAASHCLRCNTGLLCKALQQEGQEEDGGAGPSSDFGVQPGDGWYRPPGSEC